MKILLLGHREIYSNFALSLLVDRLLPQHELHIMLSAPVKITAKLLPEIIALEDYEICLCDDIDSGKQQPETPGFNITGLEELAAITGNALGSLENPNNPEGLSVLRELQPDLIISVRYRVILKDQAISVPRYGVLNIHSGLLPEYRGVMPTFQAMLNGDSEIGSTLHYIVDGTIDTGPVVGRSRIPLDPGRSYMANVLDLYPPGIEMIVAAVTSISTDGVAASHEQRGERRYHSFPLPADLETFLERGFRLCDGDEVQRLTW